MMQPQIVGAGWWRVTAGVVLAIGVAACGSKDTTAPAGGTPPADTAFTQFIGRSYSVDSGESKYECTSFQATADMYIKGLRRVAGPAQYVLFVTESATAPAQPGDHDCSPGEILGTRLVYMSGPGTQDITFSSGIGLHVTKGDYIGLVLQIVDLSGPATTGTTNVLVQTATAADILTPAEGYLVGTFNISIPADSQEHTATGGCVHAFAPQQVIGVLPTMNALGTHATITAQAELSSPRTVYDGDYTAASQVYHPITGATININDEFLLTCSYVNTSGQTVMFGDGYTDERCLALVYAEPPLGTGILDCVVN